MIYKIRVILDTKDDVFRDIEIRDKQTLFTLYKGIVSAFSLQGDELASFYESDSDWNQGREIPLEDMSDSGNDETMADFYIKEAFSEVGARMIFVYDYYEMWTFFVELISTDDKKAVLNYPLTVYRYGAVPLKAPKKSIDLSLEEDENMEDINPDEDSAFDDLDIVDEDELDDF